MMVADWMSGSPFFPPAAIPWEYPGSFLARICTAQKKAVPQKEGNKLSYIERPFLVDWFLNINSANQSVVWWFVAILQGCRRKSLLSDHAAETSTIVRARIDTRTVTDPGGKTYRRRWRRLDLINWYGNQFNQAEIDLRAAFGCCVFFFGSCRRDLRKIRFYGRARVDLAVIRDHIPKKSQQKKKAKRIGDKSVIGVWLTVSYFLIWFFFCREIRGWLEMVVICGTCAKGQDMVRRTMPFVGFLFRWIVGKKLVLIEIHLERIMIFVSWWIVNKQINNHSELRDRLTEFTKAGTVLT